MEQSLKYIKCYKFNINANEAPLFFLPILLDRHTARVEGDEMEEEEEEEEYKTNVWREGDERKEGSLD